MKVVKTISVALALLVTAFISPVAGSRRGAVRSPANSEQGSTYTITGSSITGGVITPGTVTDTAATDTIYFDVYACLTQANTTQTDDGVSAASLGFVSTGTIGVKPTSLSLAFANNFGQSCSRHHRHLPRH